MRGSLHPASRTPPASAAGSSHQELPAAHSASKHNAEQARPPKSAHPPLTTPHHTQTTTTMTATGVPQRHTMTMTRQLQAVRLPQPSAPSRRPPPEPHHWRHWREGGGCPHESQAHAKLSCAALDVPVCAHFAHTHSHLAHSILRLLRPSAPPPSQPPLERKKRDVVTDSSTHPTQLKSRHINSLPRLHCVDHLTANRCGRDGINRV
jgi:hypothetical protein